MKQLLRKRVLLPCLILMILVAAIGSVYAFYSSIGGLDNELMTVGSEIYLRELFNPNDHWLPGETKDKAVLFGNDGDRAQVIRFRVEANWYNADGEEWFPQTSNPVAINWANTLTNGAEWDLVQDAQGNDWYYYKWVLPKNGTTKTVMDSVTFSGALSNDDPHAEDFSQATYSITVYLEGLDVSSDITAAEWGMEFDEEGTSILTWSLAS